METKYYYISFIWSDLGNNFEFDVIDIHPLDWFKKVNNHNSVAKYKLINWIEITKERFDSLKDFKYFY